MNTWRKIGLTLVSILSLAYGVDANAQLLGTTIDTTITWSGGDDNGYYTVPIFSAPVTVGSGGVSQSFSQQMTYGGYATASNVLFGTASVNFTDTSISVRFVGQAQPVLLTFDFTNITPTGGQVVTGFTTTTQGLMAGVNQEWYPSFTSNSVTSLGFFMLGYQPGTDITQTATLTFGAPVPEPETYTMMMAGLGLVGFMTRRRRSTRS